MPILKSPKREAFAQLVIEGQKGGWTQGEIYERAGYRASKHAAEVAASRLLKNDEIQARIAELTAPAVRKAKITAESIVAELDAVKTGATENRQFAAAHAAVVTKAKIGRVLVDQIEVGGPHSFDTCETLQDVVERLCNEIDPPAALALLDELRAGIVARAAAQAQDVTPPEPRRAKGDEVASALKLLRPSR